MTSEYFSDNYVEARAKFLDAAETAGARIDSFRNPNSGPGGEALYTDVAVLGSDDPTATLAIGSGTHGIEGFAGSAIQTGLLREGFARRLRCRQRIVLVHAINPYGFAHLLRVNEDNVDVNRNFIDHSALHPQNPSYDALAHSIAPTSNSRMDAARALGKLLIHRARFGHACLQRALAGGQYDHPRGLFYGGRCDTWSNQTMRTIIERYLRGTPRIAFLDIHTGLGQRGVGEIIVHDLPTSPSGERAAKWWGDRAKFVADGRSVSVPLNGTLSTALHAALPESEVTAVTLAFGVLSSARTLRALQADNWLNHFAAPRHTRAAAIKSKLRDAFYPSDGDWKAIVWAEGRCAIEEAMTGLMGIPVHGLQTEGIGCFDADESRGGVPGTLIVAAAHEFDEANGGGGAADGIDDDGEALGFFGALGELLGGLG